MSAYPTPGKLANPGRPSHVLMMTAYYWPILCAATHLSKEDRKSVV